MISSCPRSWEAPLWPSGKSGSEAVKLWSCRCMGRWGRNPSSFAGGAWSSWLPSSAFCEPAGTAMSQSHRLFPAPGPMSNTACRPGPHQETPANDRGPFFYEHQCDSGLCSSWAEWHPQPLRGNCIPLQWPRCPTMEFISFSCLPRSGPQLPTFSVTAIAISVPWTRPSSSCLGAFALALPSSPDPSHDSGVKSLVSGIRLLFLCQRKPQMWTSSWDLVFLK